MAFAVVRDVFGPHARTAQAAFDVQARRAGLEPRERAFAAELAYGSIKARRLLDWLLAPYLAGRDKPLVPAIAEVLRLGAYQVRFMSGVDDHAAVSETVNLAWRHGHRGTAGLVNAILRRLAADEPRLPEPAAFETAADYWGTRYSLPSWIAARFASALDGALEAALAGLNAAPQAAVRLNALRGDRVAQVAALAELGLTAEPSAFVAESLLVRSGVPYDDPAGRWSVQGEAAAMPVDLLDPKPGERVLDLCCGRGNKSVQIAARMENRGELACVERDAKKLTVHAATLARAGVTIAAPVLGDATHAASEVRADAVLLDAPCSGLGILGRHAEARWRKTPGDAARLAGLQAALLDAAATRTKPGGRVVYSVCSLDPREGRDVVDAFLAENETFARAPVPQRYGPFGRDGDVVVPPGVEGRDGFYIAILQRSA